jgi:hypothetical protein
MPVPVTGRFLLHRWELLTGRQVALQIPDAIVPRNYAAEQIKPRIILILRLLFGTGLTFNKIAADETIRSLILFHNDIRRVPSRRNSKRLICYIHAPWLITMRIVIRDAGELWISIHLWRSDAALFSTFLGVCFWRMDRASNTRKLQFL